MTSTTYQDKIDLPNGWKRVPLGTLFNLEYGRSLSEKERKFGRFPVYGSSGILGYHDNALIAGPGLVVGRKGTIGSVFYSEEKFWPIDTTYYAQLLNENVEVKWLFYKLTHLNLSKLNMSDVVPGLKRELVHSMEIGFPPLLEQHRIATILTTVDDAIQRSRQAARETEQLKVGVMQELMTKGIGHTEFREDPDVGTVPKEWEVVRFKSIIELIQYGLSYRCDDNYHGTPVLRIPNIVNGSIDTTDLKYISLNADEINKYTLHSGDLLFVRTNGQKNLLGRCALFKEYPKGSLFASYLIRVKIKCDVISPEFILYYTKMDNFRNLIEKYAGGAADGKFNLNTESLKSLVIPIPSKSEQKQIVEILDAVDRKLSLQRQRTAHYEKIKQGLMNDLLTGRKRVKVA